MITEPGIIPDLPSDTYHSLCTPQPALSAGTIWKIDQASPAHAWFDSPMNPAFEAEEKRAFDIGEAAHLMFLEPEKFEAAIFTVRGRTKDGKPSAGYASQDAKDQRDDARQHGLIPLLEDEYQMLLDMRAALNNELRGLPFDTAPLFVKNGFGGGKPEQSYFWRDLVTGIWCKSRPDYAKPFSTERDILVDYKSMADVDDLNRYAHMMGWHSRAAWYIDGHTRLTGRAAEYWFIAQTKKAPYFVTVAKVDESALDWGRKINTRAARIFADCLQSGRWPTRYQSTVTITLPHWAECGLNDRQDAGDFRARPPARKTDSEKRADADLSRELAEMFAP